MNTKMMLLTTFCNWAATAITAVIFPLVTELADWENYFVQVLLTVCFIGGTFVPFAGMTADNMNGKSLLTKKYLYFYSANILAFLTSVGFYLVNNGKFSLPEDGTIINIALTLFLYCLLTLYVGRKWPKE